MADRIEVFPVTTAAGVAIATPTTTTLSMLDGIATRVEIIVPPGPSGLVGFRVRHSAQVIIPFSGNVWVVTDDEKMDWLLQDYPTGNKWSIQSYNTDIYPHTITFRFHMSKIGQALPLYPAPILDL